MREVFQEWRYQNAETSFPFARCLSRISSLGAILEDDTFVDARFWPVGGGPRNYLSHIVVSTDKVTFRVSDVDVLCEAEYGVDDTSDTFYFFDEYDRRCGVVVAASGNVLKRFFTWAEGTHEFGRSETEFTAVVSTPMPQVGVRGFMLEDGTVMNGHVYLVGEEGVNLTVEEETGQIRVDILGNPLFKRKECDDAGVEYDVPVFLKTINGVSPKRGDIKFVLSGDRSSDTILRLEPIANGLRIAGIGGSR